jgi:hypothetical protein
MGWRSGPGTLLDPLQRESVSTADAEGALVEQIQVHLAAGIGNIVLATPLLVALYESGFVTDLVLAADYAETADLLRPWSAVREIFTIDKPFPSAQKYSCVIPAIPPFYWARYSRHFAGMRNVVTRPPEAPFLSRRTGVLSQFRTPTGVRARREAVCLFAHCIIRAQRGQYEHPGRCAWL